MANTAAGEYIETMGRLYGKHQGDWKWEEGRSLTEKCERKTWICPVCRGETIENRPNYCPHCGKRIHIV